MPVEWAEWAQRWYRTSPLVKRSREQVYYALLKVGRWLAVRHPDVTSPDQWDRELVADWIATVVRMNVGEYSHAPSTVRYAARVGKPLSARSRHQHITLMGRFMRDCQDWGWTRLSFDPVRTFRTPPSVSALIGPDPRVVPDDVWAKLLWAGLNLTAEDLPAHTAIHVSAPATRASSGIRSKWCVPSHCSGCSAASARTRFCAYASAAFAGTPTTTSRP